MGSQQPLPGRKLGDRRVRIERPHAAYFRWTDPGQLTAKEAASAPVTAAGRLRARIKGLFIGRPLASEEEIGERLPKSAKRLKAALVGREHTVIADVPYRRGH